MSLIVLGATLYGYILGIVTAKLLTKIEEEKNE